MNSKTVLGFDFGTKSIGVAIGQEITASATPLLSLKAVDGIPNWDQIGISLKSGSQISLLLAYPLIWMVLSRT